MKIITIATAGVTCFGLAATFMGVATTMPRARVFQNDVDYIQENSSLKKNGVLYTLKNAHSLIAKIGEDDFTYNFLSSVPPSAAHPSAVAFTQTGGKTPPELREPFSLSHAHGEEGSIEPGEKFQDRLVILPLMSPSPEEMAVRAGCAIAAHILTLDEKQVPMAASHRLMTQDARGFSRSFCPESLDNSPALGL